MGTSPPIRPRILLVGLPEDVGRRLSAELDACGCECETSHGFGDAVFRASWDPPAMVLVDEQGRRSVFEAVIKTLLEETHDVPIVGIDAHPQVDALARLAVATEHRRSLTPVPGRRNRRLLLVDDDDDLREALRLQLEPSGFDILEARDGAEALAAIETQRPDVILLDLMMPRLSGVGFLQALGAASPPIVIYTGHGDPGGVQSPNVTAILQKPAPLESLLSALAAAGSGRATPCP